MEFLNWLFNLSQWMSPEHCTPAFWFRAYIIFCGISTALVYTLFAYQVLVKLKEPLSMLVQSGFGKTLGWVFVMCAIVHGAHSLAYIHPVF